MFNFQASIQASSQQRALHPGPGCRTFITILGIVMSWSVAQVSAGWAAIPNAFIPWVWSLSTWLASWLCVVQESFYFGLRKAVTSQLPPLVVTLCLSFSEVFIPSFCDVFVWRSLLFKLRSGNIRVESVLVDWTRCACLCELRGAVPLHEVPYYMFIIAAHSLRSPTFPQHIAGVCASSPRGLW